MNKASIKRIIRNLLFRIPIVGSHYKTLYYCGHKPGHYYSPIPNLNEVREDENEIFGDKNLPGIDLNIEGQIALLEKLQTFYASYPYLEEGSQKGLRYKNINSQYRFSDSVFLHCILRYFKPKKVIEIGSGHSSAIMLDTNEHFLRGSINFTFIEPFPEERLSKIMTDADKNIHSVIRKKSQAVELSIFQNLRENDILFIDSTHVSKVGSDVNRIIFEILPTLRPGVLIHFHDIFFPFELPKHWVLERRWYWNENYLLHAFLMNNENYEIINFNSFLHKIRTDWFVLNMPECLKGREDTGSIWIRKLS